MTQKHLLTSTFTLRLSLENTPIPLLYQWILLPSSTPSRSAAAQPAFQQQQRPLPLTTFLAPASSYKPLSIPPPVGVQANQTWALALWATPALNLSPTTPQEQQLAAQKAGWEMDLLDLVSSGRSACLSVVSEGVRFMGGSGKPTGGGGGGREGKKGTSKPVKGKGAGGGGKDVGEKQDRIKRAFVLPGMAEGAGGGRKVELTEQTSFDLDKVCSRRSAGFVAWRPSSKRRK